MTLTHYDENSIFTAEKLEHLRLRPTAYISDTAIRGQWHIAKEIIDNSVDELELLGEQGILKVCIVIDSKNSTYQLVVTDNGRGVPIGSLMNVFTVLHTSGKFNTNSYGFSSGSFGIGAKAAAALSKHFRAITKRPEGYGSLLVEDGIAPDDITIINTPAQQTGTVVFFEPDKLIFSEIPQFAREGYIQLVELLQLFSLFSKYDIQFYIHQGGLAKDVWNSDTFTALEYIDSIFANSSILYHNKVHQQDNSEFIRQYFCVTRPWAFNAYMEKPITDDTDILGYNIQLYAVKYGTEAGYLSLVNSVPISDVNSHHFNYTIQAIKNRLVKCISDKKIAEFFMSQYKLPLYITMNIKFRGAQFVGTHKTAFKDTSFIKPFKKSISESLANIDDVIVNLYTLFEEDIISKYKYFVNGAIAVKSNKQLIFELNFPDKYLDCSSPNRDERELFLTEGDSAKSGEGRDSYRQALYPLRGKPYNAITAPDKIQDSIINLQNNKIFQDVLRIINLTPNTETFEDINFGKIFIMADADNHGKHIVNLVISNLYIINPKFIEAGFLHIVVPPLYGFHLKSGAKDKIICVRSAEEGINKLAAYVYFEALEIGILSPGVFDTPRILNKKEFVEFVRIVCHVGDMFTRLSKEHVIDPIILEQLAHVTYYLTPETMDLNYIRTVFNNENIQYDSVNNILFMSVGLSDIIISLNSINESLYREILPFLNRICWQNMGITVSTRFTDVFKDQPISFVQLYQIFKSLDNQFSYKRWKGIGSMTPQDKISTCMNPDTRVTYQITSIGDVDRIFALMGSDSEARKNLLTKSW